MRLCRHVDELEEAVAADVARSEKPWERVAWLGDQRGRARMPRTRLGAAARQKHSSAVVTLRCAFKESAMEEL
jgi:hypothetical protein